MKSKGKATIKKRLPLPEDLEKRLAVYALAAGAAGVCLAATAQPAQATIYTTTNVTATLKTSQLNSVSLFSGKFKPSNGTGSKSLSFLEIPHGTLGAAAGGNVMVDRTAVGYPLVPKLSAGATIGPADSFKSLGFLEILTTAGLVGDWTGKGAGYIGFDFMGKYYGWAKVSNSVTANGDFGGVKVLAAAIDFAAGQPIKAGQTSVPEPGTLSLLALGAVGLLALRKKRLAAADRESAANG